MKFSCEKALLSAAVSVTSRAVAVKSSIAAMEGILVEAGDILRLTEGDLSPVSCDAQCERNCPSRAIWAKLGTMIDEFFDGITLAQLMEQE